MFTSQNSAWAPSVWVLGVLEYLTKYMYIPVSNLHNFSQSNTVVQRSFHISYILFLYKQCNIIQPAKCYPYLVYWKVFQYYGNCLSQNTWDLLYTCIILQDLSYTVLFCKLNRNVFTSRKFILWGNYIKVIWIQEIYQFCWISLITFVLCKKKKRSLYTTCGNVDCFLCFIKEV